MQTPTTTAQAKAKLQQAKRLALVFRDFTRFVRLLTIQPKEGGGRIPFRLNPIQRKYNKARTPRDIVLKSRQIGLTSLELARDLWVFLTRKGANVVVVVQSQTDMGALKDVAKKLAIFIDSLEKLGIVFNFGVRSTAEYSIPERDATLRIIQAGASEAAAEKKGRGGTITRLHVTEAAFFEQAEATFNSLTESIYEHGTEVIIESTPNGLGGFYYDQWVAAIEERSSYKPHFFEWWLHPEYSKPLEPGEVLKPQSKAEEYLFSKRVPLENIKWRRWKIKDKGGKEDLVTQEYPNDPDTCFLVSGRGFFDGEKVKNTLAECTKPIRTDARGLLQIWEEPQKNEQYVVSADPAEGLEDGGKTDNSACQVHALSDGRHVATIHGKITPEAFAKVLAYTGKLYNFALLAVEKNNHGGTVILELRRFGYKNLYWHVDSETKKPKLGWHTNTITRPIMLDQLDSAHRAGHWSTHDRATANEMRTFIVKANGKAEAANGSHDDLVIASAINLAVRMRPQKRLHVPDE